MRCKNGGAGNKETPQDAGEQHSAGFKVAAAGLEPANVFTGSEVMTEESGHTGGPFGPNPGLSAVIDGWPKLSKTDRWRILKIIEEAIGLPSDGI